MSRRSDEDKTARQVARSNTKARGDRSTRLAHVLMELKEASFKRLDLEEDLRADIARARAITSLIARRRAERTLAGDLRRYEITDLEKKLDDLETGATDVQKFHLAEHWRARLIDDDAALAEFPPGADAELPRLIDAARRERDTGRPPGAARALFRHVMAMLP